MYKKIYFKFISFNVFCVLLFQPVFADVLSDEACRSSDSLGYTGYPEKGNKTNWCRSQGYDGVSMDRCIRQCPDPYCVKIPVVKRGYKEGNKTQFCLDLGYDGQSDPFGDMGGYCYKGPTEKCSIKEPPKKPTPRPKTIHENKPNVFY